MKDLSRRQREILEYFDDYSNENGYPPTLREICKKFEISSTNGARYHLHRLKELGYIEIEPYRSRGVKRVGSDERRSFPKMPPLFSHIMPILGRVPAGALDLAAPDIKEDEVGVDPNFFGSPAGSQDLFGLRVKGDSMIDAGIHDGDVVVVKPQGDAYNGQIVVARVGEEATVKRFHRENGCIILLPENPAYDPIRVPDLGGPEYGQEVCVIGVVVGLIRSM